MEGIDVMIGRNDEKKYLLSLLEEEDAQFVAVFGRRRIGKTYMDTKDSGLIAALESFWNG